MRDLFFEGLLEDHHHPDRRPDGCNGAHGSANRQCFIQTANGGYGNRGGAQFGALLRNGRYGGRGRRPRCRHGWRGRRRWGRERSPAGRGGGTARRQRRQLDCRRRGRFGRQVDSDGLLLGLDLGLLGWFGRNAAGEARNIFCHTSSSLVTTKLRLRRGAVKLLFWQGHSFGRFCGGIDAQHFSHGLSDSCQVERLRQMGVAYGH